jgi:hypothetical protein
MADNTERAYPAIKTRCDVSADGGTWLEINGLESHKPNPTPRKIKAYMRHNKGKAQSDRIGIDFSVDFAGNRLVGTEGGARDASQQMIETAWARKTTLYFRVMDADETTPMLEFTGVPDMTAMGEGGDQDYGKWAFTVDAEPDWTFYGEVVE